MQGKQLPLLHQLSSAQQKNPNPLFQKLLQDRQLVAVSSYETLLVLFLVEDDAEMRSRLLVFA
ncbi:hypothetical protein D3C76_1841170 [compost metagenome]